MKAIPLLIAIACVASGCASRHELATCSGPMEAVNPSHWQPAVSDSNGAALTDDLKPDSVWDDGRSTFMRFNGLRRVPNVYTYLPGGDETNGFGYTSEPDAGGTTLRIGKTAARWILRDGDRVGCIFNKGPDPDGRTSPTIAPTQPIPLRSARR